MRSHYCGQVNESLTGQTVQVAGWVHRRRDHGGVIFIDLRDRDGLLQVVIDPDNAEAFAAAERVRSEFVLSIEGLIRARPAGTANANLASGQVEMLCRSLTILNRSEALPFQLDEEVREEIRLRYRYLDLRRDVMRDRLLLRHKATRAIRNYLDDNRYRDADAHQGDARGRARLPRAIPHPSRFVLRAAAVAADLQAAADGQWL